MLQENDCLYRQIIVFTGKNLGLLKSGSGKQFGGTNPAITLVPGYPSKGKFYPVPGRSAGPGTCQ